MKKRTITTRWKAHNNRFLSAQLHGHSMAELRNRSGEEDDDRRWCNCISGTYMRVYQSIWRYLACMGRACFEGAREDYEAVLSDWLLALDTPLSKVCLYYRWIR